MVGQRSEYGANARVAGSARAYTATRVTDKELLAPNTSYAMMHSMSAMVENANLSVEEIRARERRATVNQPTPTFSFGARAPSPTGGSSAPSFTFGAQPSPPSFTFGVRPSPPSSPFGAPTSAFGAPSSAFGAPPSPFGAPPSPFGAPPSPFGAPPSPPPGGSGARLSAFGAQTSTTSNPFGVQSAPTKGGFDTRATSSSSAAYVFGAPSSMGPFVASPTPGASQGRGRGNGGGRRERHVRRPSARTPRQGEAFAYPPRVATDAKFGTAATSSAPFAPQTGFGASTPAATPAFGGFSTGAAFGATQSAAQSASGASPSTRGTLYGTSEGTFHTSPSAPSAGAGLFNVAPTAASGAFAASSAAGSALFGASTPVTGCGLFGASTPAGGGLFGTSAPKTGSGSLYAAQPVRVKTPFFADASQAASGERVVDDGGVAMEIKTTVQEPAVVVVVLVVQDTKPSDTVISDVAAPTMEPIQTRTVTPERQPDVEQATETASEAADASVSPQLPLQPAVAVSPKPNDNGTTRPVVDVSDAQVAALEDYLQTGFGLVHDDGVDSGGMPVVTVNVTRIPGWAGSGDLARSMQLLTKALTTVAEKGEYSVVVYFGCDDRAKGVVPGSAVQWLRDIHDSLPRTSKKNVKKVVFVNVPTLVSALISVTMRFVSAKAAKKFVWAKSLADMDKATNYHLSVNHCGERFKRSIQYVDADAPTTESRPA